MAKNATINMRVDASLKTDVERILHVLGISTTEAINMFLNRVRLSKGIPFPVQMSDDEFRAILPNVPVKMKQLAPRKPTR